VTTVFFDFETGGILETHPDIQLAAIAVDPEWRELATFERKIQFDEAAADPKALEINHYNAEVWWEQALPVDQVVVQFAAFISQFRCINKVSKAGKPYAVAKLAGHNAATFDAPRLRRMFGQAFLAADMHVLDTLQLALWHFHKAGTQPENFRLTSLCKHFEIPCDGAHDAFTDCRLSAAIARVMTETVLERTVRLREAAKTA
jgi:DNA polymerase III alpha subunit (gram-positive type)